MAIQITITHCVGDEHEEWAVDDSGELYDGADYFDSLEEAEDEALNRHLTYEDQSFKSYIDRGFA